MYFQSITIMRSLFVIVLFFLASPVIYAQDQYTPEPGPSTIEFYQEDSLPVLLPDQLNVIRDKRLNHMLRGHIENNKRLSGMKGFRIEIYFSSTMNAKEESFSKKREFMSRYPEHEVHIKYVAPNFRVRIGDFRTRSEALKIHKMIKESYPGAFIVPDIIKFPLLKPEIYE